MTSVLPFPLQSGSTSSLKLEIEDPAIKAIEFLIFDEARNIWQVSAGSSVFILIITGLRHQSEFSVCSVLNCRYKNNGENFHIRLPIKDKFTSNITVPEDLVQIQAYLRWERKGKQMYSTQQEKASDHSSHCKILLNV